METVLAFAALVGIAFVTARFFYELFNAFFYLTLNLLSKFFKSVSVPSKSTTAKVIFKFGVASWVLFLLFLPILLIVVML